MTHRQNLTRLLAGQQTDWVPNYELGAWGQTVERWCQEGMPPGKSRVGTMNMFEGENLFQLDRRAFAGLDTGMLPGFTPEVLAEDADTVTARHANGVVTRALKTGTVRGTRLSMDTYLAFPVTDRESFRRLAHRYRASDPVRYPFWWDEQVRLWEQADYPVILLNNGAFGLYSQLRSWVGTEPLSYLFYDDPALIDEMLEFATDFLLALVEPALSQVSFTYFNFFEDCAGKGSALIGPSLFRRFFMQPYKRIITRLNQAGIQSIWVDSDGDCEALLPLWMEAGVNCSWPLEQASGMDPIRLRKRFGRDLILAGGIDKRELAKGPAAIDRELESKLPVLLAQGGYIPFLDHTAPPEISYANYMYYIERKLELMGRG